jgi:transposase
MLVGCDLHEKSLVLQVARGVGTPVLKRFENSRWDRLLMIAWLRARAKEWSVDRIVFAYEASGQGFGLCDELQAAGMECHVLAPSKLPQSRHTRTRKTDPKDALRVLEVLRGHVLGGNELPQVWVPSRELRDDRELVRQRLSLSDDLTRVKLQVQSLLKRNELRRPVEMSSWTLSFWRWLNELAYCEASPLAPGARRTLLSLIRQVHAAEQERERMDLSLERLAATDRWRAAVTELRKVKGVGLLTAMTFLTELGDMNRFRNRRQLGSYLGLAPSSHESGEVSNRKGHITRSGSSRLRKVLCQAVWSHVRYDPDARAAYQRLKAKNPLKVKIAIVAGMRRLGIKLWHVAQAALNAPTAQAA